MSLGPNPTVMVARYIWMTVNLTIAKRERKGWSSTLTIPSTVQWLSSSPGIERRGLTMPLILIGQVTLGMWLAISLCQDLARLNRPWSYYSQRLRDFVLYGSTGEWRTHPTNPYWILTSTWLCTLLLFLP